MTFGEIFLGSCGGLAGLLTLIQVIPIKVDPWSAIARGLGKALNKGVMEKLEDVERDVKNLKQGSESLKARIDKDGADACRNRILRFSDELRRGVEHSEEFFNQILEDMSDYERFCADHPDYKNSKAECAVEKINSVYKHCMEKDSFL